MRFVCGGCTAQVLRMDEQGKVRRMYVKRRDLLRENRLQPRDLRRIDPAIDFTKTGPSITIKVGVRGAERGAGARRQSAGSCQGRGSSSAAVETQGCALVSAVPPAPHPAPMRRRTACC